MSSFDDHVDISIKKEDHTQKITQEPERGDIQIKINSKDGEFLIEKIIKKRIYDKKQQFLVKWLDLSSQQNTWESLASLQKVKSMIYEFELGLPQTGVAFEASVEETKGLDSRNIERIIGHDRIDGKVKYLVIYEGLCEPQWISKTELTSLHFLTYKKQLKRCEIEYKMPQFWKKLRVSNDNYQDENKEQVNKKSRKNDMKSSSNAQKKQEIEKIQINIERDKELSNIQIRQQMWQNQNISKNKLKSQKNLKRLNDEIPKGEQADLKSDAHKIAKTEKKKTPKQQNLPGNQQTQEILSEKQDLQDQLGNTQIQKDMNKQIIKQQSIKISEVTCESQQKPDEMTYKEENFKQIQEGQLQGSFEAGDKESKVIVRHSESELEEMIFEVFWMPRKDGTALQSKLVKYQELKMFSPYSLIDWLEIIVKNALMEIESNQRKIYKLESTQNMISHKKESILGNENIHHNFNNFLNNQQLPSTNWPNQLTSDEFSPHFKTSQTSAVPTTQLPQQQFSNNSSLIPSGNSNSFCFPNLPLNMFAHLIQDQQQSQQLLSLSKGPQAGNQKIDQQFKNNHKYQDSNNEVNKIQPASPFYLG